MRKYEKYNVEATDENIMKSIRENLYDRGKDIKSFIEGLDMIDSNMFISLDAKWGEGKTFFIRQIEMTLKYLSKRTLGQNLSELEEFFNGSALEKIELQNTYFPVYYNAWLYDCHSDPLMSLLYVLIKESEKYVSTNIDRESIGKKLLSLLSPFSISLPFVQVSGDFEKLKESFSGEDILSEIKTAEEIRTTVKQIFDDVITESAQKLVVFIDELDRCKPSYAIEMLERIKHYFDDDRIIFVAALNKEQLVHTISKYYGSEFDSTGYLNKFFDINIFLPEIPEYTRNRVILKTNNEQYHLKNIVQELGEYFKLSLRDTIVYQQNMEATSKQYYNDYTPQGCFVSLFVPIIVILDIVDQRMKGEFLQAKGSIFQNLCENIVSIQKLISGFGEYGENGEERYRQGYEKINRIYRCTFGGNESYDGLSYVPRDLKEICIRVCNGM